MKKEHIKNHFEYNPIWKGLFCSKYPNWSEHTWCEDAWKIFEQNNYTQIVV